MHTSLLKIRHKNTCSCTIYHIWFHSPLLAVCSVTMYVTYSSFLSTPTDPSLTLSNLALALDTLPDAEWSDFGIQMLIPLSKLGEIQQQFHSDGERKKAVFSVYMTEHPQPTWEHVSDAIYQHDRGHYHSVLNRLQSLFPTGECVGKSCSYTGLCAVIYLPPCQ